MIYKRISDLLFPKHYTCVICGDEVFNRYDLCEPCLKSLPYIMGRVCLHCSDPLVSNGDYCKRCKGKKFYYDRAISPFVYDGEVAKLIHGLKYNNKRYLAEPLSVFMADKLKSEKFYFDMIVPVPLCAKRYKERGYNQSLLLANELSKQTGIVANGDVLIRIKETPTQTSLDFMERQSNLLGAFKVVNKKAVKGKSILLVDDVFTTGATVTECARMLKDAGASTVYVLTVAHTNKDE